MNKTNKKPEMHQAVCDKCNEKCEVPFNPTPGKPIYCSKCFEQVENSRESDNKEMHRAVCDECGKDCTVPFKPTTGKPIYCSDCFEQKNRNTSSSKPRITRSSNRDSDMKYMSRTQYDNLNHKLTTILEKLEEMEKRKDKNIA